MCARALVYDFFVLVVIIAVDVRGDRKPLFATASMLWWVAFAWLAEDEGGIQH